MRYVVGLALGLGIVMLYLLSTASTNATDFANDLPLLLGLGVAILVILMLLVGFQLVIVRRRIKARVFGSKLTLRLVLVFTMVSVLPGVLMYAISVHFLAGSIESWFDVRVDSALEGGLNLGRVNLEAGLRELHRKADTMALSLSNGQSSARVAALNDLREQAAVDEAALLSPEGDIIAFSGSDSEQLLPVMPNPSVLRQVRLQQPYLSIEEDRESRLRLRVAVPVNQRGGETEILQLVQPVSEKLARDAAMVQEAYRDYQELSLSREGLNRLYTLSLTLSLGLALLSVLLLAIMFSNRLSAPLGFLAAGTRAVAQGDFSQRQPVQRQDELGLLTESFNAMTHQLSEAQKAAHQHQEALTGAKAYLESILTNLSAGVISFDAQFRLRASNRSAEKILGADLTHLLGSGVERWEESAPRLVNIFEAARARFIKNREATWQEEIEVDTPSGKQVLLLRGSQLLEGEEKGYVVVFDDVTKLLQAQRYAAWGEVARRLAHEIKNPLTPIQLSAERLERRLSEKLEPADFDVLNRSTQTIVNQVTALKSMVNAFSEYARSPEPDLAPVDLNALVCDVLELYQSLRSRLRVELDADLPTIYGDSTKLRQVLHNLLQNAEQAVAEVTQPQIVVRTQAAGDTVSLSVHDNGGGFPEQMMGRVFEPYVTSKTHGTGLGLAIVKKIVEEHNGSVVISNPQSGGALVEVRLSRLTGVTGVQQAAVNH
ncbi:MAG: HAMP domain-containing protein [Burkholderiales bacterium]|nr:HAMP domain-containing protein [Burkholderiales bacterium]